MTLLLKQFSGFPNVGDRISTLIVEHVAQHPVATTGRDACTCSNLIAVGSIMHWADECSTLWGCGALDPRYPIKPPRRVLGVRGRLSADLLRRNHIDCPDIFGDPGVFLPELFSITPSGLIPIGFVPHCNDAKSPFTERCRREGIAILEVGFDPSAFVERLTACARVISSSLHGLVIAHAFGIPAAWIALSEMHGPGVSTDFKFFDYYSSFGISRDDIHPESAASSLERIVAQCQLPTERIDKEGLRAALRAVISELIDCAAVMKSGQNHARLSS
jgi:pyruvyltransferase